MAKEARLSGHGMIDQIIAETFEREAQDLRIQARREADAFIVDDIRQAEPFTQIDTRVGDPSAARLSRLSPTVPEGSRWVRDEDLPAEKAEARQASIITRFASGTIYIPAGG
ncbi:hypothetical protein HFO63_34085 [Rhizobium laguerreae]|uniref:hypothetical protein n=1 Tax=Rhizobium laguerreae TaxID=1076926 RepID=UPI001C91F3CE|nr:hypothetical protein [Rhizobium laguerreae]MBY3150522.1 hypothetical protein [Rhizobium laguerreae]MBY3169808.1 hypothetical protein [Rhizobium laguerreae]MBY3193037.1 hypothetical protein [Rhizobium laguerreae]